MSKKKASDLVARLTENVTRPAPAAAQPAEPAQDAEAKPKTRARPKPKPPARKSRKGGQPVRYTVVLERDLHRALRRYALDRDVDASEVVRALLQLLLEQPDLDRQVIERLASGEEEA